MAAEALEKKAVMLGHNIKVETNKNNKMKSIKENTVMREFQFIITDPAGIHARPAGLLVKEAAKFTSKITISKGGKEVDLKRILGLMGLGVKQNDKVFVKCEGEDEQTACQVLEHFFKDNL